MYFSRITLIFLLVKIVKLSGLKIILIIDTKITAGVEEFSSDPVYLLSSQWILDASLVSSVG